MLHLFSLINKNACYEVFVAYFILLIAGWPWRPGGVRVPAPRLRAHAAAGDAVVAAAAQAARQPRPRQDQVPRRMLHQEQPRAAASQVRPYDNFF